VQAVVSFLFRRVGFGAAIGVYTAMLAALGGGHKADDEDISIREFCELPTPIFMFDKDGAFVVMRLEQVCRLFLLLYEVESMLSFHPPAAPIVLWTGSPSS
jgi:hypothetical protein